jgi:plastocyanin
LLTRASRRLLLVGSLAVSSASLMLPLSPTAQAAMSHGVSINNRAFTPPDMTVAVGDTVTWTNATTEDHNVRGGPFSSPALKPNNTFAYTFKAAGAIKYVCDYHPTMKGTITVK